MGKKDKKAKRTTESNLDGGVGGGLGNANQVSCISWAHVDERTPEVPKDGGKTNQLSVIL